jgi:hypothetical protein
MAKTSGPVERKLSPHHSNSDYLSFALDRIAVLEQLVAGLAMSAGAHQPYIDRWLKHLREWPDNPQDSSLSQEAQYLEHEVRHLKLQRRGDQSH